ncbi:hypothetical protein BKA70DRAFT_47775 [Coprinopsis sp. MPI-PUGE-AT-0042]|nr:hypothetical protein BKA70DRAFT_47775 [Coprinopsis sp. MPI-PUGE-AT-0042]
MGANSSWEHGLEVSQDHLEHLKATQVVGWNFAAAVAFLVYDVLITFPDEVRLIWPIPWSFTKVVFFFIRYFPIVMQMSTQFYGVPLLEYSPRGCYIWNVYQALGAILVMGAVDYILILRVFAMYPRNKTVRWLSVILYAAEMSTMAIGIGLSVPQLEFDKHCVVFKTPITTLISAGCPIVYQAFLFGVTLWKFIVAVKEGWGHVPLVVLLIRDGTWAFLLLFLILSTEAALFGFTPGAYSALIYGWLNTAFSVCGYRILLNLHNASDHLNQDLGTRTRGNAEFTSIYTTTASDDCTSTMTKTKRTYRS